jgi:hypothetical protein
MAFRNLCWFVKYPGDLVLAPLNNNWRVEKWFDINSGDLSWFWLVKPFEPKEYKLLKYEGVRFLIKFYHQFGLPVASEVRLGIDKVDASECMDLYSSSLNTQRQYIHNLKPVGFKIYSIIPTFKYIGEFENGESYFVPEFTTGFINPLRTPSIGFLFFKHIEPRLPILDTDIVEHPGSVLVLSSSDPSSILKALYREFPDEHFISYFDLYSLFINHYSSLTQHVYSTNLLILNCLRNVQGLLFIGDCASRFKWELGFSQAARYWIISFISDINRSVVYLQRQIVVRDHPALIDELQRRLIR